MNNPILLDLPDSIETERLLLRCPMPGDGKALCAAINDTIEDLRLYFPWAQKAPTPEESEQKARSSRIEYLERTDFEFYWILKESGKLVGCSGLHRIKWEIPKFMMGYWTRTGYRKRGYAAEAVSAISNFTMKTFGAKRIELLIDPENIASRKLAEKLGFKLEGELRNARIDNEGVVRNDLIYSIVPEDWSALFSQSL